MLPARLHLTLKVSTSSARTSDPLLRGSPLRGPHSPPPGSEDCPHCTPVQQLPGLEAPQVSRAASCSDPWSISSKHSLAYHKRAMCSGRMAEAMNECASPLCWALYWLALGIQRWPMADFYVTALSFQHVSAHLILATALFSQETLLLSPFSRAGS